jgi:flavin reductase (DIM6/NTAB) family NADH-FMN oxidoreductase RutF
MSFDVRTYRKALGCFPTGVTVVTTVDAAGAPIGVTVNSFTSLSLDPPLVLFCLDNKNSGLEAFQRSGHFVINVLRYEQRELSITFASRNIEKWKGVGFDAGHLGAPILHHCLAHFECSTVAVHEGGDHSIFIGRVDKLDYSEAGQPLVYYRGTYAESGCGVP